MTEDVFKGTLNRIPIKKAAEILVNTAKEIAEPTKNLLGLAKQLGLTVEQIQTLHSVFVEAGGQHQ